MAERQAILTQFTPVVGQGTGLGGALQDTLEIAVPTLDRNPIQVQTV